MQIPIEPHLEMRVLQLEDAPSLDSLRQDYTAYRGEWMYRGTAREFIEAGLQNHRDSSGYCLGIFLNDKLAGVVTCSIPTSSAFPQVDYVLGNAYRGCGLATKAVRALVSFLFRELKIERVRITADADNLASRAVAERLGFTIQSTVANAIDYRDARGDMVVYETHHDTWRAA
jgi:ribosomal-protein-serine acetyltransferase